MIIKNRLIFGYGDIFISVKGYYIDFTQMKLEQEIGRDIDFNFEHVGETIKLDLTYEEANNFLRLLNTTENYFVFKNIYFDFMEKEKGKKSKQVMIESVELVIKNYIKLMAC